MNVDIINVEIDRVMKSLKYDFKAKAKIENEIRNIENELIDAIVLGDKDLYSEKLNISSLLNIVLEKHLVFNNMLKELNILLKTKENISKIDNNTSKKNNKPKIKKNELLFFEKIK